MQADSPSLRALTERRASPRKEIFVQARCLIDGQEYSCLVKNLSKEGVLFYLIDALTGYTDGVTAGASVYLEFEYELQRYNLECRIIRIQKAEGVHQFAAYFQHSP